MQQKGSVDLWLLLTAGLLLVIGLVSLLSASSVVSYQEHGSAYWVFLRQLIFAGIGVVGCIIAMVYPLSHIKKLSSLLLLASVILLVVVLLIGGEVKGGKRWIDLGLFSIQPSEFAKIFLIIFLAHYLSEIKDQIQTFKGLFWALVFMGIVGGLIVLGKDLGTAVALMGTCYFMLIAAGAKKQHLMILFILGVGAFLVLAVIEPYRFNRLMAFLHYEDDPLGDGYQIIQSIYALGSGGILGAGLGKSKQKYLYLPENHTDFIFPIVGEELGFIGTFTIVSLFTIYAWRGLRIAMRSDDLFRSLLAVGLTMQITFQAFLNIGVVIGLLPVTGITLPFFSYGGSSLVVSLVNVGLLLNLSRYAN
ncbi:MAG TPA: putative lipid II flippase FtsW [Firmicutes bacterium]|jgi:cell division protein FtsW|nr:putative lipid II flippase FtsW [Bacillota bacterium]